MSIPDDIGDNERQQIPVQERFQDIVSACELLRREGLGNLTPNDIAKKLYRVLKGE